MSRLIETIRLKDGEFTNVDYHAQRMCEALLSIYQVEKEIDLEKILQQQSFPISGLHKCRVIYDDQNIKVEFEPYTIRPVNSLKLIVDNEINYAFKFKDRTMLDELFEKRQNCDDILILKNDNVTDSSYANILFRKGREWITPSSCLLKGTFRHFLLDNNQIKMDQILRKDIRKFDGFKLINAMLRLESPEVNISRIID
jgi:4-amino-4-deoxychorismate lyase